uniref:Uncharacterized protein n=1 Tax=Oryza barthii TaxID=65489 RepID=A0A0D3FBH3_9ORYZ
MAGQAGTCPVAAAAKTAIRLAPPHANQVYLTGARDYPSPALRQPCNETRLLTLSKQQGKPAKLPDQPSFTITTVEIPVPMYYCKYV